VTWLIVLHALVAAAAAASATSVMVLFIARPSPMGISPHL
jgi:hypothetical protein